MDNQYFAGLPFFSKELAQELLVKKEMWHEFIKGTGIMQLWAEKMRTYYGMGTNGSSSQRISYGGSQGELSLMRINDFRNLLTHVLTLITSQRPAGQAKAVNTDSQSLRNAKIGTAVSEYYLSQGGYEQKFVNAVEVALVLDESFIELGWNAQAGDKIAVNPDSGNPIFSGDPYLNIHCPYNVARDVGALAGEHKWYIISCRQNKWDLIAKFPQYRDHILGAGTNDPGTKFRTFSEDNSDYIYVDTLHHERTPSVPDGRQTVFIQDEILMDGPLPFPMFPVERLAPSDVIDGTTGYSSSNDLMGPEQLTDALHSIIATNNVTFGTQCIVGPKGAGLNHIELAKGLRYLELDPMHTDKIRALQLTKSSPETYSYISALNQKKGELSGVDSITRGNPEGALKGASGSAMALIQAQSLQFNSGAQRSYFRCLSNVMTKFIEMMRVYATSPRIGKLVGKSNSAALKDFKYTGKDLNSISSISYEMVNPVSQSIGGRLQMAQDLLGAHQIKNPKQYINVLTTGNVEVLLEDDENDQLNILAENEAIREGKTVRAIAVELHADHIKSHSSLIASPEAKEDQGLVERALSHIQDHLNLWMSLSTSNPALLVATGQQVLPPSPPPGGAGGPPSGPPGPPNGQSQGAPPKGPASAAGNGQSPVTIQAQGINMPNPAQNKQAAQKALAPQ